MKLAVSHFQFYRKKILDPSRIIMTIINYYGMVINTRNSYIGSFSKTEKAANEKI